MGVETRTEMSTQDLNDLEEKVKVLKEEVSQLKEENGKQVNIINHLNTEYGPL